MKTLKKFCCILAAIAIAVMPLPGYAASDTTAPFVAASDDTQPSELLTDAASGIVFCGDTSEIIWEQNADARLDPASTTKLMTALLAAENLDLEQVIEVTGEAAAMPPTKMWLQEGEHLTAEELLYGLLLPSGNDAAVALAIAVAGSVEDFAQMMNERADAIGCTGTHFVNPHGLDEPEHYSTAKDLAIIAREAFANETVRRIAQTSEHVVPATDLYPERKLKNSDLFLEGGTREINGVLVTVEKYDGVFGGKTGSVGENKCTMVTALESEGMKLYCAVMGTTISGRYSNVKKLMDYGREHLYKYAAFEEGEAFGRAKLLGGATNRVNAVAAENGYVRLTPDKDEKAVSIRTVYDKDLKAPIKAGARVGEASIYVDGELKKTVTLTAEEDVPEGWLLSAIGITNFQTACGLVVLAAILALLLVRRHNKRKRRKRRMAARRRR